MLVIKRQQHTLSFMDAMSRGGAVDVPGFFILWLNALSKEIEPINMFASASYEEIMARLAFLKDSRDMGLVRLVPAKPRLCGLCCWS